MRAPESVDDQPFLGLDAGVPFRRTPSRAGRRLVLFGPIARRPPRTIRDGAGYDEDPNTHEVDTRIRQSGRQGFGQWVLDTARTKYDQAWLDYQYEIGLRYQRSKNKKRITAIRWDIRARDIDRVLRLDRRPQ